MPLLQITLFNPKTSNSLPQTRISQGEPGLRDAWGCVPTFGDRLQITPFLGLVMGLKLPMALAIY